MRTRRRGTSRAIWSGTACAGESLTVSPRTNFPSNGRSEQVIELTEPSQRRNSERYDEFAMDFSSRVMLSDDVNYTKSSSRIQNLPPRFYESSESSAFERTAVELSANDVTIFQVLISPIRQSVLSSSSPGPGAASSCGILFSSAPSA
jgi:hypothetical protein